MAIAVQNYPEVVSISFILVLVRKLVTVVRTISDIVRDTELIQTQIPGCSLGIEKATGLPLRSETVDVLTHRVPW